MSDKAGSVTGVPRARAIWEPPVRHRRPRAALAPVRNTARAMWEPPVRHRRPRAAVAPVHNTARAI